MLRLFRRDKSALKREVCEGKNSYCWLYRGIAFAERLCSNMNRLFRIKPFLFGFEIKYAVLFLRLSRASISQLFDRISLPRFTV